MASLSATRFNWLAAGAVAALLVPALVFGIGVPFVFAGGLAIVGGLGAGLALTKTSPLESLDSARFGEARIGLVRDLIAEAEPIVARLEAAGAAIRLPATAARVRHLAAIASGILEGIAKDPLKLDRVRRFVTYYLPRAAEMAEAYCLLESTPRPDPARLSETAAIFERLDEAFARYAHSLVEADLQKIDLDMKLLTSSLDDDLGAPSRRNGSADTLPAAGAVASAGAVPSTNALPSARKR